MVILDIQLDNFYAFQNFHMNLTYPKKIVDSCIEKEHLEERPNFRYKKVNIIMGGNASGKTTLGRVIMKIFNFIDKKNYEFITDIIRDQSKDASFTIDMASKQNILYRVVCNISPSVDGKYSPENIKLNIYHENIRLHDSYESCVKRIESVSSDIKKNYLDELEKIAELDWFFEYPRDTGRIIQLPKEDKKFQFVLEYILKALDPSIKAVKRSKDVSNAYVIHLQSKSIILQDGEQFTTNFLSSGTKEGVEVAKVISALIQGHYTFYYCDEKFPYIHSDIEKAILSLMINSIRPDSQLFFTSHNTDILDMNLPKHAFTFLRKDVNDTICPIKCINASSLLKRNTDSLKSAVENDLFCTAPSVDLIYDIQKFK